MKMLHNAPIESIGEVFVANEANVKSALSAARVREGEIREFIGKHKTAGSKVKVTFRRDSAFDTTYLIIMIENGGIRVIGR